MKVEIECPYYVTGVHNRALDCKLLCCLIMTCTAKQRTDTEAVCAVGGRSHKRQKESEGATRVMLHNALPRSDMD